jgi:hypothetical protein
VFRRIPLTRGATLEEAEAAIRSPPVAQALFPFRVASAVDNRDDELPHQPSSSREAERRPTSAAWHGGQHAHGKEAFAGVDGNQSKTTRASAFGNCGQPGAIASAHPEEGLTRKKGIARPHHSKEAQKYSVSFAGKPVESLLTKYMERNELFYKDSEYCRTCLALVAASLARNTWKRYNSAFRLWGKFQKESGLVVELLDVEAWEKKFLIWGWRDRGLKVNTLKIYLSELKELGRLAKSMETMGNDLGPFLVRGMSNLATPWKENRFPTKPLTVEDLRSIRKGLENFDWKLTGQSVWTCCVVAFWGAFRLGELLGSNAIKFDKFSSLLWEDVQLGSDSAKIRVKSAKVKGPPGNSVLLFPVPDKNLCPVTALCRLEKSERNLGMGSKESPVFRETNGNLLTKKVFLQIVNSTQGGTNSTISGKSFQTGLPSAMESFPEIFRDSHVKALGRWRGRSYQTYMKNDTPEFRWVFGRVASALLNKNFSQENREDDQTTWTESWNFPKAKSPRERIPVRARKTTVKRRLLPAKPRKGSIDSKSQR